MLLGVLFFFLWEAYIGFFLFGSSIRDFEHFLFNVLGIETSNVIYSPASVVSATSSPVGFWINIFYRVTIVAGVLLMLLIERKSAVKRAPSLIAFFSLFLLAAYVLFPSSTNIVSQPYRLYDLFLPLLAGAGAYFLVFPLRKIQSEKIWKIIIVVFVVIFSLNTILSVPTYQFAPWSTLTTADRVAYSQLTVDYFTATDLTHWLYLHVGTAQSIAADYAGYTSLNDVYFGIPNLTIVDPATNAGRVATLVTSYYLAGYELWHLSYSIPNGSIILENFNTEKVLKIPSSITDPLSGESLVYSNGNMFIYVP